MTDRLFIRLDDDEVTWLRQGVMPAEAPSQTGSLSDLSEQAVDCQVIVFVPGNDVGLLTAKIPPMSRQRMVMAIPFALEEQLIANIDSLHFAFGKREDGSVPVAVVADELMSAWLSRFREAGIHPDILVPETLALPLAPDAWTILVDEEEGLVRSGALSGFVVDLPNLSLLLQHSPDTAPLPQRIHLLRRMGESAPAGAISDLNAKITEEAYRFDILSILGGHFDEQRTINLLQGKYNQEAGIDRIWRAWRIPAALLVVWFLIWISAAFLDMTRLSQQSQDLEGEIQGVYRQVFPEARNMSNLRVRMERSLDALRKANPEHMVGFLELLDKVGSDLQSAANMRLISIHFRAGELELRMEIDDLQAFEKLKARLIRTGLSVEVQSVTTRDSRVTAHLEIR
uniref:Type II secretion system protein L n=1 Tax=Candidatus Kentrum sp. MB TaxID=2138164 RepID=A0A450XEA0_9GAMM|nr:MAG: general secretion pathway protein L [Candidatus Kentron sp. MB]VFK32989.1 MAG: general secretion pathway protein L [Candidatus Kentron sp. MB]VFK75684.1 MAG: general secretion pathway protein L [Candidatus Kentron sp. MB]